MGKDSFVKVDQ